MKTPGIRMPPAVSIIVPVLGEADRINETAAHLADIARGHPAEIIIVDGDPQGSTIKKISRSDVRTRTAPRGRGAQMNAGAAAARGNILLFVHADTTLPQKAIGDILEACRRPGIAGGAFSLGIRSPRPVYRLMELWANLRSRLTGIAYGDQALFIKKRVFASIGGFREFPIMEDAAITRRLTENNFRIRLLPATACTSARRWEKEGILYGIIRNNILSALFHAGVSPRVLVRFYPDVPRRHSPGSPQLASRL